MAFRGEAVETVTRRVPSTHYAGRGERLLRSRFQPSARRATAA